MAKSLDKNGCAVCTICGQKKFVKEMDNCNECGHWVCVKSCSSNKRIYGCICEKCKKNNPVFNA